MQYCKWDGCLAGGDMVSNPNQLIPTKIYSGIAHEPLFGYGKKWLQMESCDLLARCFDGWEEYTCDCPSGWESGRCMVPQIYEWR